MTTERQPRPQGEIAAERAQAASEALRADTSIPDILRIDPTNTLEQSLPVGSQPSNSEASELIDTTPSSPLGESQPKRASRKVLTRFVFNQATDGGPFTNYTLMMGKLGSFSDERTAATLAAASMYPDQTVGLLAGRIGYDAGMRNASDHARNYLKRIEDRLGANGIAATEPGASLFDTLVVISNQGKKLGVLATALIAWSAADPRANLGAVFGKGNKETSVNMKDRTAYIWEVAEAGLEDPRPTPQGGKARATRDALVYMGYMHSQGQGHTAIKDEPSQRAIQELADITSAFAQDADSLRAHADTVKKTMFANPSERPVRSRMSLHDTVAKVK